MILTSKSLGQASSKIKAISKILPYLISNGTQALELLLKLVTKYLQVGQITSNDFTSRFYVERIVDILESVPLHKNFIKDQICELGIVRDLATYTSTLA